MNNKSKAFNDGYQAAKSGCHINNSYPYERPSYGYWEWLLKKMFPDYTEFILMR